VCGYLSDVDNTPIGKVGIIKSKPFSGCEESSMVIAESIGQFTGLHDKNGKEIYEGDIIKDKKYNYKHLIRYSNDKACFTATIVKYVGDNISERFWESDVTQSWIIECGKEIIGNIHDNPELMEGGEE
jgi:uncharacterized phage protein (TIGR01671 family)